MGKSLLQNCKTSGLDTALNKAKKLLLESKNVNEVVEEKPFRFEGDFFSKSPERTFEEKQANAVNLNTTFRKENVCIEHKKMIQYQKDKINYLTKQLENAKSEVKQLQNQSKILQTHASETRVEAERQASLIASLTSDAASKNAMLHQLDSAIGRLTTGWQSRDVLHQSEVTKARQAEEETNKVLAKVQQEYHRDRESWQKQISALKTELNTLAVANEQENGRHKEAIERSEQLNNALQKRSEDLEKAFVEREVELLNVNSLLEQEKQTSDLLQSQNSQLKLECEANIKEKHKSYKKEAKLWQIERKRFQETISRISHENQQKIKNMRQTFAEEYEQHLHKLLTEKDAEFQLQLALAHEAGQENLREASERYRQEIDHLRRTVQSEMARRGEEADAQLAAERSRVKMVERQVERWRSAAREAEEARSKLAQQMNHLLQARCAEAMQVLHSRPAKIKADRFRLVPEVAHLADRLPAGLSKSPSAFTNPLGEQTGGGGCALSVGSGMQTHGQDVDGCVAVISKSIGCAEISRQMETISLEQQNH